MKKIVILFFFLWGTYQICLGQLKSQTSEIFELSSIVFRLAGAEEYINDAVPEYTHDIDTYFTPYVEHDFISYIKKIRGQYGIGYDAVMNAAACLTISNGNIVARSNFNLSDINKLDPRWTADTYAEYIGRLNNFYQESRFNKFYRSHEHLYNIATERLDQVLSQINADWFKSFFGKELGEPIIVASLSNGRANYAFGIEGDFMSPGIVIGCRATENNLPIYSPYTTLPLIVHELSHGFSNALMENAWDDRMASAVLKIFSYVQDKISSIGYDDPGIMLTEWFNNLCELMYFRENPSKYIDLKRRTGLLQKRGFIWLGKSVDLMDDFYNNRETFITIKDYIPYLLRFIEDIASDFQKIIDDNNRLTPYVTETSPVSGDVLNTNRIIIKFSIPMLTNAYGYEPIDETGVLTPPIKREYWLDNTTFIFEINTKKLHKNKKYGIRLHSQFFQSEKTYPLAEHFSYFFQSPID